MSKPNIEAKKERHKKLFEGQYQGILGLIWFNTKRLMKAIWFNIIPSRKRMSHFMHPLDSLPAPKRLYTQLSFWSIGLLIITSLNVNTAAYSGGEGVGLEYLTLEGPGTVVSDDDGYIVKSVPVTGETIYDQNRIENVKHTVQSGETLSLIALRYGVGVSSIRYANANLGNSDYLKVGQEITIPPKDGLYVKIGSGDSLVSLVEKYKGNVDETKAFAGLDDESKLTAGEELFIVDGRPPVITVASNAGSSYSSSLKMPTVMQYSLPVSAEGWIRPTTGRMNQGYGGGHYGYDIGNSLGTPILAAASGTVVKALTGCPPRTDNCGGGYGNHIIIDHGNGYQTLYAHNEALYVSVGDYVNQGDVIAGMGNTGRVRGRTGLHLHFEISYNGVKQSPKIMGVW